MKPGAPVEPPGLTTALADSRMSSTGSSSDHEDR